MTTTRGQPPSSFFNSAYLKKPAVRPLNQEGTVFRLAGFWRASHSNCGASFYPYRQRGRIPRSEYAFAASDKPFKRLPNL